MIELKLRKEPRKFQVRDYEITDFGEIVLAPEAGKKHELVSIETASGKKCEVCASQWGFYVGSSLNARMKDEGFRMGLMLSKAHKLYLVAVEREKLSVFEEYLVTNESRLVAWVDDWTEKHSVVSPKAKTLGER